MTNEISGAPTASSEIAQNRLQWFSLGLSLFSLAASCLTIAGLLQTAAFAWIVLMMSVVGLAGAYVFLRDQLRWRIATCIFAFVLFVLLLMMAMDGLASVGFQTFCVQQ